MSRPCSEKKRKHKADAAETTVDDLSDGESGSDLNSDAASLCTAVESGVETELDGYEENVPGPAELADDEEPPMHGAGQEGDVEEQGAVAALRERAARGHHTVWSSGYFTLQNDPAVPYVRVRMLPRWMGAGLMGRRNTNKSVTPKHFGENKLNPRRSCMVLRAWAIWRMKQHDFPSGHATRRTVLNLEVSTKLFSFNLNSLSQMTHLNV